MSSLRALKRRQVRNEKDKYQKMISEMSLIEMNQRLLQQGIGQADLDRARDEARKSGFKEGGMHMTRTCYAAAIRVLKRDWEFTEEQLIAFLEQMDVMTLCVLDHQEMVEETLEETGIRINFSEGVDRVERTAKKITLCEKCALGRKTARNIFDCDAADGPVAGKTACENFREG